MNEKTDSERLKALEEQIDKIKAFIGMRKPGEPTIADFDRAIAALVHGDKGPLNDYLARGKVPAVEAYKLWSREAYGEVAPSASRRRDPVQALRKERQKSCGKGRVFFIGAGQNDGPAPQSRREGR